MYAHVNVCVIKKSDYSSNVLIFMCVCLCVCVCVCVQMCTSGNRHIIVDIIIAKFLEI